MHRTSSTRPKYLAFIFGASLFLYLFIWTDLLRSGSLKEEEKHTTRNEPFVSKPTNEIADNECLLPYLDPWHPGIKKLYAKNIGDKPQECTKTLVPMTVLEDGVLKVNIKNNASFLSQCHYRCLHYKDDWNLIEDEWKLINVDKGVKIGCDIVETKCQNDSQKPPHYRFMHNQFVEQPPIDLTHDLSDYNFYWIFIDSVSHSMVKRSMLKTLDVLMNKMDAVEFPFLNKIGLNTRVNSNALLLNKRLEKVEGDFSNKLNNWNDPYKICSHPMDNLDFIGYDFRNEGFKTMFTDDWSTGVLDWFECVGFKNSPVDHNLRPFWLKIGHYGTRKYIDEALQIRMYNQSCKSGHHYDLEHILQFDDSYKGKPKFALSWLSDLAHDDNAVLFATDEQFAEFFEKLNEKSKNSFIFFQADHGIRFGDVKNIPIIGEIEDKNPFLYVVVPEKLRKNPTLMSRLKVNSMYLLGHYDLYATVAQIAKFSHEWTPDTNFNQAPKPIPNRELVGTSIFHKINQPRSCESLQIPEQYCLCRVETVNLNDTKLGKRVAQVIVDFINKQIHENVYNDFCSAHFLAPDYPIQLEKSMHKKNTKTILKVRFMTLPGRAIYQGAVELKKDGSMILAEKEFPRQNAYKIQAHCIPEGFFKNYCVCEDLLEKKPADSK